MSQQIDDGGAAFPHGEIEGQERDADGYLICSRGMSLRDWLAGQALAGLMANPHVGGDVGAAARGAYMHADAMLAARNRRD